MSNVVYHSRYLKADHKKNNNKFWYISMYSDNSVTTEYGRVGNSPQSRTKPFGSETLAKRHFDKMIRSKERKGYRKIEVVEETVTKTISPSTSLKEVAKSQIQTDSPETVKLVEYLAEQNVHTILQNTTMSFNKQSGLFETPCGIVTRATITKARDVLVKISDVIAKDNKKLLISDSYGELLNDYLMLIPQKIGTKFNPETLYRNLNDIKKQNDILDSLGASIDMVEKDKNIAIQQSTKEDKIPQIFSVKLELDDSGATYDKLNKLYNGTKQSMHSCSHLKIKKIYTVEIKTMFEAFEKEGRPLGSVWELWHGTRVSNLLSILKVGLIVPPSNAGHCTGRMFGNGIYFSDQSTKALNYAHGYWGGSRDNNCFMFLADVAMGKYCVPKSSGRNYPLAGYDSTFAQGNKSGVMNNEMIVPKVSQCNLKYLVQFG